MVGMDITIISIIHLVSITKPFDLEVKVNLQNGDFISGVICTDEPFAQRWRPIIIPFQNLSFIALLSVGYQCVGTGFRGHRYR